MPAGPVWLWRSGAWILLALVPYGVAGLAYRGAVAQVAAYGAAVTDLLTLDRHDLYRRVGLPPVKTTRDERERNQELMKALRCDEPRGSRRQTSLSYDDEGAPPRPPPTTNPPPERAAGADRRTGSPG